MDRLEMNELNTLRKAVTELKNENAKLKSIIEEYKSKEQTISSAIIASMEHAKQLEASKKKLYSLDIQRTRLLYLRMEQTINDLYRKYPELRKDTNLREMSEKFKSMIFNDLNDKTKDNLSLDMKKQPVEDPIKKLLHNIIDCFDTKKVSPEPKEKPEKVQDPLTSTVSNSGFDFNEALHPTMELDEIMKSFNLGNKKDKN